MSETRPSMAYSPPCPSLSALSPSRTGSPQVDDSSVVYESEMRLRPYLADSWTDSRRMAALFAEFRAREANPEGFDLKLNYWVDAINKWCTHSRALVFTVTDVQNAFQRSNTKPNLKCIQLVLSHMKRNRSAVYVEEFDAMKQNADNNQSWINWGLIGVNALLKKPLLFGASLLSGDSDDSQSEQILADITDETKFVNIDVLKLLAEELNKMVVNSIQSARCMSGDQLYDKYGDKLEVNRETFAMLIWQLKSEGKARVMVENGIDIVKFGKNARITELDIGLAKLETAKHILNGEIDQLNVESESLKGEARVCVKNKSQEKAVLLLKRKKRIENQMLRKETQLENVETLMEQLLNSNSHQLVLHALQKATDALKVVHNSQLRRDVENTIADVEDTLEEVSDVISDISRPLVSNEGLDVDNELQTLLQELEDYNLPNTEQDVQISQLNRLTVNDESPKPQKTTSSRAKPLETA